MSAACSTPGNSDISGIGVRLTTYASNFLYLFLAIWALWGGTFTRTELDDAESLSMANLIVAFAVLISSIFQASTLGMSSYHGNIVLLMSWMNNTNTFVYIVLYTHHELGLQKWKGRVDGSWSSWIKSFREEFTAAITTSDDVEGGEAGVPVNQALTSERRTSLTRTAKVLIRHFMLVMGSLHITLMSVMGIWLWRDGSPLSFGVGNRDPEKFARECGINTGLVAILGHSFPFRSATLRKSSLVIYTLFLVPGINLVMPAAIFMGMYVGHQRWNRGEVAQQLYANNEDALGLPYQRDSLGRWRRLRQLIRRTLMPSSAIFAALRRRDAVPTFLGLSILLVVLGISPITLMALSLAIYVGYQHWDQERKRLWTMSNNDSAETQPPPHQRKPQTDRLGQLSHSLMRILNPLRALLARVMRWNALPASVCLGILLVINIVLAIDIELTLRANQVLQGQDEAVLAWGPMFNLISLLRPLRGFIQSLLNRRSKQRQLHERSIQQELDENLRISIQKQDFNGVLFALKRGGSFPGTRTPDYFAFWNLAVKHDAISEVSELRLSRMTLAERELDAKISTDVQKQNFSAIASAYMCGADLVTAIFHSVEAAAWILDNAVENMNPPIRNYCVGFDGTHVNQVGRHGQTPLTAASRQGDERFVRLLLENPGIDVNLLNISPEFDATTPLIAALEGGHLKIARLLLHHPDIDPNRPNQAGDTPLITAARTGCRDGLLLLLQQFDVDVNLVDARSQTALMHASQRGYTSLAQMLLERPDTRVNLGDTAGDAALTLASCMGHSDIVLLLLEHPDTDIDQQNGDGRTAWDWALSKGHAPVLQGFLRCRDSYAAAVDSRGYTPLMIAAELGHEDVIQILLERDDTQLNAVDDKGSTALILASKEGRDAVVRRLLEHSAVNIDLRDDRKRTAWDWALHQGHASVLKVFNKYAVVDVNQVDSDGLTPLMCALELGHIAVVRMLLGRGDIQLSGTNFSGMETSTYASRAALRSCIQALLNLPGTGFDWEDLCGTVVSKSSPSADLDGKANSWLNENALGIEEAIPLLREEQRPVAHALAKGIYPRLSLLALASVSPSNARQWGTIEVLRLQCETSHPADQILSHHSVKDLLQNLLDECLDGVELRRIAGIVMSIDVQRLAIRTLQMLSDPEARRRCLHAAQTGKKEQDLVDILHALLDIDTLKPFRAVFLRGLLRFAKAIGKFPRGLIYNDVVVVESGTAITAGAFGDVWRGVLRGQSVAMKVMRTIKRPEEILRNCSKEAVVWSQLRHPNVLPFYGIYYWTPHSSMALQRMALLSPWLDAGNAVDYLRHHLDVDKESLILDIAQGLNYLHAFQPAIVHGDLKGNNILINSEGRACLADFGLSKLVRDEDWVTSPGDSSTFHGCQYFSAPELLFWELDQDERETSVPASPPPKTTESDVYAFGCVCYQLYTGKPRFFDLNIMDRLLAIRGNKRCRRPSEMSDKLWENVEACWSTLPQERPAMAHFVQSLAIENDTEVGLGDHSCDSPSGGLVWDGRTNPHVPLDIFQLTFGLRKGST